MKWDGSGFFQGLRQAQRLGGPGSEMGLVRDRPTGPQSAAAQSPNWKSEPLEGINHLVTF